MSTYRLMDGANGRPGDGPATPISYDSGFSAALIFTVTVGAIYFEGYWWWVCPDPASPGGASQSASPQEFCLWCIFAGDQGTIVDGSVVTSGILTPGQWNYVPLPRPVPIAPYASYVAQTGFTGPFPDTHYQFGADDPYSAGIVNGPLFAYSDQGGSAPCPPGLNMPQGLFAENSDPTAAVAARTSNSENYWIDVQVTDTVPAGASYRLWPNYPWVFTDGGGGNGDDLEQTFGIEFKLTEECTLDNIWYFSPAGVTPPALPAICGIFDVVTRQVVPGTLNTTPAWSGPPGSGWVACSYSGVRLAAGDYKACVYTPGGSDDFYLETEDYWGIAPAGNGIVAGPLNGLSVSQATGGMQCTFNHGSGFVYPQTWDADFDGQNRWIDIEVTPSSAGPSRSAGLVIFFP